ncbi:MAG: hypothetical protein ACTSRI_13315 [Promethearchaeota archaeon]
MNTIEMVKKMCHEVLNATDIKEICKNRGFSIEQVKSREILENIFLSERGVAKALSVLTHKECILMHLLKFIDKVVDITFFKRIYGTKKTNSDFLDMTFAQAYKGVFKEVKQALIRRGILLIVEKEKFYSSHSKMEGLGFFFPHEFEKFLPSIFKSTKTFTRVGNFKDTILRDKLSEIIRAPSPGIHQKDEKYCLNLIEGDLYLGKEKFQIKNLFKWQRAIWSDSIKKKKKESYQRGYLIHPIKALIYAFKLLKPQEWVLSQELLPILSIFCYDADVENLDFERICQVGWQNGCLVKLVHEKENYYRLSENYMQAEGNLEPKYYLKTNKKRLLSVDLKTIPYQNLEYLNQIANLQVINGQLIASPNLVKMGRSHNCIFSHSLTLWLKENDPSFCQAIETFEQRWGKVILHKDILIAKIKDISLKVSIQKSFNDPSRVLFLPNDFIVFPQGLFTEIENLIIKSGNVIKKVKLK